ncbi:MAG: polysaccharide deacetylase family protein [Planctomycetia bacterium]|nr:polysaccharide deacetylase family protein [Planctomycetia bacterium]
MPFLRWTLAGLCLAGLGLSHLHGGELVRYEQEITLEFSTPQEAQQAELVPLELPPGKTLAVTSRWDDSNPAHLEMSKTLKENGWKGSFLINRVWPEFTENVLKWLLADGSDIGAHTCRHPHLETIVPNAMFREIVANRVDLESATDHCVTAFTFPFGLRDAQEPQNSSLKDQGEALVRSGLLGGGEYWNIASRMGLSPEQFLSTHLIHANDKDPDAEQFAREWKTATERILRGETPCGAVIALGVHSWQKQVHPDGFERLSKILATQSHNPQYWYCNMQDYMAYRLGFLKNSAVRKSVEGNQATFVIQRTEPFEWGSEVPMGLQVQPVPQKVLWENQTLQVDSQGAFLLPHTPGHAVPKVIGRTDSQTGLCDKIDGIRLQITWEEEANQVVCHLENNRSEVVKNLHATLRVPLRWTTGVYRQTLPSLEPGEKRQIVIPLSEKQPETKYQQGKPYFVLQLDFTTSASNQRLYAELN